MGAKITELMKMCETKEAKKSNAMIDIIVTESNSGKPISLKVSQGDSIRDVKEKIMFRLQIPFPHHRRLYFCDKNITYWEDLDYLTVSDYGLKNGSNVFIKNHPW